jgi:hypothetical protein
MSVTFHDLEDEKNPLNDKKVRSSGEALAILDKLASIREPFFCTLRNTNDRELLIGVGNPGCVQHSTSDGKPPYQMAVTDPIEATGEYVEFLAGGTPSPVPREYCISWQTVREVAAHFVETGAMSAGVNWESI